MKTLALSLALMVAGCVPASAFNKYRAYWQGVNEYLPFIKPSEAVSAINARDCDPLRRNWKSQLICNYIVQGDKYRSWTCTLQGDLDTMICQLANGHWSVIKPKKILDEVLGERMGQFYYINPPTPRCPDDFDERCPVD